MPNKSIRELVMEYFYAHPNEDIKHAPIVDWVTEQWLKSHPEPPRDVWRAIRSLHEKGLLIKVKKGVYRYDPKISRQSTRKKSSGVITIAVSFVDGVGTTAMKSTLTTLFRKT